MKKFLDTFVLTSIWRQLFMAFLFGVVIVALSTPIAAFFLDPQSLYNNFHSSWLWSLLHLCDGGSIAATITTIHASADKTAGNVAMFSAFVVWLVGAILFCFITGAISNAFEVRKEKISSGLVRYKFNGKHGIIIGWDYQGVSTIIALKELYHCKEIVILSSKAAEEIRDELENSISEKDMKNIFIHKGNVFNENELKKLAPHKAEFIVILGDQNDNNNDAGNIKTATILYSKLNLPKSSGGRKIPCFVDIDNPYNLNADEFIINTTNSSTFFFHVLNFYKYSANELLSSMFSIYSFNKGKRKSVYEYQYSPLAYRKNPEASHVHIMVSGFDNMAHLYIIQAIRLLQPSRYPHKISIFSNDEEEVQKFMDFYAFEQLQNIKIEYHHGSVTASKNRELVTAIVKDISASVTLLIAEPLPAHAMEEFHRLPPEFNFENIRIIIEQQLMTKNAQNTYSLRRRGYSAVDYIGLLDKFYYSLLKQDEFAEKLINFEEQSSRKKIGWLLRDTRRYFSDTILEKLYHLDMTFDEIVEEQHQSPRILDLTPYVEQLAIAEHQNYIHSKILSGYRYDSQNNDRRFCDSLLKPWEELSQEQQEIFRSKVKTILPAVNDMFGKADEKYLPCGIFEHKFRWVCGFSDNSETPVNWVDGEQANNLYQKTIRELKRFQQSTKCTEKIFRQSQKHDRYPSLAVLCTLANDANAMFADMAKREQIPVIAVLPQPPELYQYQFEEGKERDLFWQRLRNVYTYYVIPEEVENPKEYINEIIAKYSDEVWHIGKYELPQDTGADLTGPVKYIQKRSTAPVLREIQVENTTAEAKILLPEYPKYSNDISKNSAKRKIK